MIGKKKGSFFILCRNDEGDNYVEKRDGWIKDNIGYSKSAGGRWTMTDVESGLALPNSYSTLDDAYDELCFNLEKVYARKETEEYLKLKSEFEELVSVIKTKE